MGHFLFEIAKFFEVFLEFSLEVCEFHLWEVMPVEGNERGLDDWVEIIRAAGRFEGDEREEPGTFLGLGFDAEGLETLLEMVVKFIFYLLL